MNLVNTEQRVSDVPEIIKSLKKMTTESSISSAEVMIAAKNLKGLCEKPDLSKGFISQVRTLCPDIEKNIPDFAKALNALGHIPLNRFSHPKEVLLFVDALIESGTAAQSEQGLIFVLGNTNTGKTSLVNTFKDFVEHPTNKPCSVLTKPDDSLIETQVLEVYDGLSLKQGRVFKVEVDNTSSLPVLVNLKEEKTEFHKITTLLNEHPEVIDRNNAGLQLKIVDLGNSNHLRK